MDNRRRHPDSPEHVEVDGQAVMKFMRAKHDYQHFCWECPSQSAVGGCKYNRDTRPCGSLTVFVHETTFVTMALEGFEP